MTRDALVIWSAIAAFGIAVIAQGCADRGALNAVAMRYEYSGSTVPPAGTYDVCTHVTLVSTVDEVSKACNGHAACGRIYPLTAGDRWVSMTALRPESFNDRPALILMGHELLHNLGATHD